MSAPRQPVVLPPGGGRRYAMGRLQAVFKADGDETANRYSISEWWLEPRTTGPGAHAHEEDDVFYVLAGTVSFLLGERWLDAEAGSFVLVPAGTFQMGSPPAEPGRRDNEGPVHEVVVPGAFYLGVHPVTQSQYMKVVGANPSRFQGAAGGGPEHPVECVNWDEAAEFCRLLSALLACVAIWFGWSTAR